MRSRYHMREAGSTLVQEVAFALADAITYVQAAIDRGVPVDAFAPRFAFNFTAGTNVLEEAAKFRAMRRLWARLMRERFGAREPASWAFRTGAGSGASQWEIHHHSVRTLRAQRDGGRVSTALDELRAAAAAQVNLMPVLVEAVKTYATVGEICGVLREVFGEYQTGQVY